MGLISLAPFLSTTLLLLGLRSCGTDKLGSGNHIADIGPHRVKWFPNIDPSVIEPSVSEDHRFFPLFQWLQRMPTRTIHRTVDRVTYELTTITATSTLTPSEKGYKFYPNHGWYKLYPAYDTFREAKAKCEDEEANMVVLNSKTEMDIVLELLNTVTSAQQCWVGITDSVTEGTLLTIFGGSITGLYNPWTPPAPGVNSDADDCVSLSRSLGQIGLYPCDVKSSAVVCEI